MSEQPTLIAKAKPSWWSELFERCKRAVVAFRTPYEVTTVRFDNGLVLDLANKCIVVPGDLTIHATGDFTLSSDKHVIIQSGCDPEEREGYVHSVWLNPSFDEQGRPIKEEDDILIEEHNHDPE